MSYPVSAIEQEHRGDLFRSRSEAKWREFFWQIDLPVHYEHQGYDLKGIWYLPDFYIPKWKCYFEVKDPSVLEDISKHNERALVVRKAGGLSFNTGHRVIVSFGSPRSNSGNDMWVFMPGLNENVAGFISGNGMFGTCKGVDVLYIETSKNIKPTKYLEKFTGPRHSEIMLRALEAVLGTAGAIPRKYLIPLHSSVGFNFVMIKQITKRIFAPFSDPLLCNFNAPYFDSFKPYTDAYKVARQLRFEHKNGKNSSNVL